MTRAEAERMGHRGGAGESLGGVFGGHGAAVTRLQKPYKQRLVFYLCTGLDLKMTKDMTKMVAETTMWVPKPLQQQQQQ
jgi:hypothetical protein